MLLCYLAITVIIIYCHLLFYYFFQIEYVLEFYNHRNFILNYLTRCLSLLFSLYYNSQGAYSSQILADLAVHDILSLQFLQPSAIPEDNNFSFSFRYSEFLGQLLKAVVDISGGNTEKAAALYQASGINLIEKIKENKAPKQSDDEAIADFVNKYNTPFLK